MKGEELVQGCNTYNEEKNWSEVRSGKKNNYNMRERRKETSDRADQTICDLIFSVKKTEQIREASWTN